MATLRFKLQRTGIWKKFNNIFNIKIYTICLAVRKENDIRFPLTKGKSG